MTATVPTHRDASPTETAAARRMAVSAATLEGRVLAAVVAAGNQGLTAREARETLGLPVEKQYSISPRLSALKRKGLVDTDGRSREDFQVYVASSQGAADVEPSPTCLCGHSKYGHAYTTDRCVIRACGCTTFRVSEVAA